MLGILKKILVFSMLAASFTACLDEGTSSSSETGMRCDKAGCTYDKRFFISLLHT